MDVQQLISSNADELDEYFGWIDWRSHEIEVVETVQAQLGEPYAFDYREDAEGGIIILFDGREHPIPLTHTGCDRYVMICSLAEILSGQYEVWLSRAAMEDDTHGVLVLPSDQSEQLVRNHPAWVEKNLQPLNMGFDEFNGITIPYCGHEENRPEFERQYRALQAAEKERREKHEAEVARISRQYASATPPRRKISFESYVALTMIIVCTLIAVAAGLYSVNHDSDCRIKVDGKCLDPRGD